MQVLVCVMLYLAQHYDLRGALVSWDTCEIAAAVAGMTDARCGAAPHPAEEHRLAGPALGLRLHLCMSWCGCCCNRRSTATCRGKQVTSDHQPGTAPVQLLVWSALHLAQYCSPQSCT